MPIIQTNDGTPIYVKDQGGGPPVVLIHGWPVNADMWEYQAVPLLEQGFRVISYDRRGFGRSGQPGVGYDYDTMAADLAAVMDQLGLEHATLVGFSMGGGEVVRYLAAYGSARVRRAVLVSSVVPYLLRADDNPDGVPQSVFDGIIDGLRKDRPAFLRQFGRAFYGVGALSHPVSQEILDWHQGMCLGASPVATIQCVRAFSATDLRKDLAKVQVPVLVVHGDADQTVPIGKSSDITAKMLDNATYKVYRGAPHGLFVTHKEQLTEDLVAFLRS